MKLLAPKELNNKLQEQKASEISQGMFLAKKVDALRENLQNEQKKHDDSVSAMKLEYKNFLEETTARRGALQKEIKDLEEKRTELLKPLDAEWDKVKKESFKNSDYSLVLIEKDFTLKELKKHLEEKEKELSQREDKVLDSEIKVEFNLQSSETNRKASELTLLRTQNDEAEIKKDLQIRAETIKKRETDIAYREIDAENKWNNALQKEKDNEKETKRIESKQRQLSAAFAELEKRNGTI